MNTQKQVNIAEGHMLDALEKCQEIPPHVVIFAGLALLTRAAYDMAPSERIAQELIEQATEHQACS
jgi:hypothetical protein